MLIWNPGKLTKDGKALLAKAQAGKCAIQITKAQSGSGSYTSSEDISQRTALKTVKQTFPISNKVINTDSALVLKITMENSTLTAGYDITEFGVFASDPDKGEILYSIATASTSDYMPAYNGVVPSVINMSCDHHDRSRKEVSGRTLCRTYEHIHQERRSVWSDRHQSADDVVRD